MVVREDAGHDNDGGKYNTQVKIVVGRLIAGTRLDGVGDEAQDGANPQQQREATKEIFTELDPFRRLFGRRQRVRAVALQVLLGFGVAQTLKWKGWTEYRNSIINSIRIEDVRVWWLFCRAL